ncbi:HIT-like domain-containing protein [Globomyces pollinis-pini]|nr:HIT-like domain-containing protein [Globomyces pollinis-pini]
MNRIRPCTLIHILKYSSTNSKRLKETPELYTTVVKPYIESIPKNRTSWIANLFNGVSEQESILYKESDPLSGFLILPDSKWDKVSVNQLYLLVITENVDIKSLRDLNDTHILLLQQIQAKTLAVLKEKYGIGWEDVRLFVHYQPSYYQFHIHVVHSQIQGLDGAQVGQAHLLEDIIDNINLDKDYYKKKTLSYFLSTNHPLFTLLQNE